MATDCYKDGTVSVWYVSGHTNHSPGKEELKFLPLPSDTRRQIQQELSLGIPMR
eukprot:m.27717 g.27717  ORF g.27717 m.27717 type:complete len:54 (+) comp30293_c0_seq3:318-479(+)